jgi:hypothetical protein
MRHIALILVSLIIALLINMCDKVNEPIDSIKNDSITLKYIDINPDTTFINLFAYDTVKISVESWTEYYGPHPYKNERVWIRSNNPSKVMLSFGKIQNNELYSLDKDSVIDESIVWQAVYVSGGYIQELIGYRSNYVGLRIIENDKINYGWIHTPTCYKMTEYAIDTSNVINRKIYAGRLKK